jgi:hypothetical protein
MAFLIIFHRKTDKNESLKEAQCKILGELKPRSPPGGRY